MKSILFDFKTAQESWFEQASQLYVKKIKHFTDFEIQSLKSPKVGRDEVTQKQNAEAAELLKKINQDDLVVLFDEKGKSYSTMEFVEVINKSEMSGKKRLVYIIGGAFGVSDEIKKMAAIKIALSGLVMNHLVAEVVALEQIYRAYTIKNRIPYHNT